MVRKYLTLKSVVTDLPILFLLFVVSSVKIVLFNCFLLPAASPWLFALKFLPALLMTAALYWLLLLIGRRWLFVLFLTIQAAYMIASLSCYLSFHSYLQLTQAAVLLGEALTSASHSATPWTPEFLILLIDLPFITYVIVFLPRIRASLRTHKLLSGRTAAFGAICLALYLTAATLQSGTLNGAAIISKYGTVANNLSGLVRMGSEAKMISTFQYGAPLDIATQKPDKPNFVILQVESMDSTIINQTYKGEYVMPFLHSLTQQSVYFPYMLSYHKGGGTSDIEFSVINSVESLDGFPAIYLKEYGYPNSFLSRFSENSYRTYAFHGNLGRFYSRNEAFPKMGFDTFYDIEGMGIANEGWGAPDDTVLRFAADQMKAEEHPFLSYIITMTSHTPFTSAAKVYSNHLYDGIADETVKNYFNSMSYVDQSIKDFVADLRLNVDNTYIFIFGDHTPNVSGALYDQSAITIGNEYLEFVPLFILTPDNKVHREDSKAATMLDISPTILKLSGIPFQINTKGGDLLDPSTVSATIPLRGIAYDRRTLFSSVKSYGDIPLSETISH